MLTVEGGAWTYHGTDPQGLIGRWARDHISVREVAPAIGKGWTELDFDLTEDR